MKIHQLAFDFDTPFEPHIRPQVNLPWPIASLARRYHLPRTLAAVYAAEMRLPVEEV